MSLIYTAISSLEKKSGAHAMTNEPQKHGFAIQRGQGASLRWIYAAGFAAVLIGGGAVAMVREYSKAQTAPVAASAPAAVVALPDARQLDGHHPAQPSPPAVIAPLQQVSATVPQPIATPEKTVAPATVTLAAKHVESAPVQAVARPEAVAIPSQSAILTALPAAKKSRSRASSVQETVAVEPARPSSDDLNRLAAAVKQAIDSGNKDEAESKMRQLAANLPPESITLLRLRAWQALRNKDQAQAMALYGKIVDQLPDDETAAINLAVLNWNNGQREEARRLVGSLAERRPDSDTLRQYLAQFGERR